MRGTFATLPLRKSPSSGALAQKRHHRVELEGPVKRTYEWFKHRINEYDAERASNNGKLARHDWWRYAYYKSPYLILESNEAIVERFTDIFTNSLDISSDGKITPTPMMENDHRLARLFTEIIEETNWRGVLHKDSMSNAKEQLNAYFENGTPIGVKLLDGVSDDSENILFKFSKSQYVQDMYNEGRFRISPASYYSKGSHLRAVRDLETIRSYKLKGINEVINGSGTFNFQGNDIEIQNGVVPIQFEVGNYFLFSTCQRVSRRMPTDFDSDAVLIIHDKESFLEKMKLELEISWPDWEFLEREVYYYDPYNDLPTDRDQEFYKHFSYAYQREHRCIVRPRQNAKAASRLEPFFVELGPLSGIAEMRKTS